MPSENLDETEVDDENEIPDPQDEEVDNEYDIDVEQALSKDIKGVKPPDPEKIDKAQRLGFDLGIDPSTIPPKTQSIL
jgi:hypothetical protein